MKSIDKIKKDYELFIDIQIGKYLESANKSEFSNEAETKLILDQIIDTYNEKIASDYLRLDNSNKQAKAAWFNSVEIDFEHKANEAALEHEEFMDPVIEKSLNQFYENFPFLPEGSIAILLYIGPALEAYGLPLERFEALVRGEDECTQIEEDIILWAFDLTVSVMGSIFERGKKSREKAYNHALKTAQEELNRKDSITVVNKIKTNIKDFVDPSES